MLIKLIRAYRPMTVIILSMIGLRVMATGCHQKSEARTWLNLSVYEDRVLVDYDLPEKTVEARFRIEYNILFSPAEDSDVVYELFNSDQALPYLNVASGTQGQLEHSGEQLVNFLRKQQSSESVFWLEYQINDDSMVFCSPAQQVKSQ